MRKELYESPELEIRWYEPADIISVSLVIDPIPGDGVVDDDDWW